MGEEFGKIYSVEVPEEWSTLNPQAGQVLEVNLLHTNLVIAEEVWAGFFVHSVLVEESGGVLVQVRYIGCEERRAGELVSSLMTGQGGTIHLCPKGDCRGSIMDPASLIHAREVRLWTTEKYLESSWITEGERAAVAMWVAELTQEVLEEQPATPKRKAKSPTAPKAAVTKTTRARAPRSTTKPGGPEKEVADAGSRRAPAAKRSPAAKATTRRSAIKAPGSGTGKGRGVAGNGSPSVAGQPRVTIDPRPIEIGSPATPKSPGTPGETSEEAEVEQDGGTFTDAMKQKLRERLAKAKPGGLHQESGPKRGKRRLEEGYDNTADGELYEDTSFVRPAKRNVLTEGSQLASAALGADARTRSSRTTPPLLALGDSSDVTSKSLRNPLVAQALSSSSSKKKRKKKKKVKGPVKELTKVLTALVSGLRGEEGEGRKKKKTRRRVLRNGVIESISDSSSEDQSSEPEEGSAKSDSECEAPLRRRSQQRPGSVLEMLTDHVKECLDQSATTTTSGGENSVTSGVKIMTYFMLQIKPNFPTHLRELREMFHLASVIDSLRQGDLLQTGDALAARFVAIHQSMLDSNWNTAKHMELHSMDDGLAASPALVLATRKHSRMILKSQGYQTDEVYYGKGRGRGGRGDWQPYAGKGDTKSGKGKGGKNKGKPKGKQQQGDWQQNNEWKDKKEKPAEKTT